MAAHIKYAPSKALSKHCSYI